MHRLEIFQHRVLDKVADVCQFLVAQNLAVRASGVTLIGVLVHTHDEVQLSLGQVTTETEESNRQREKVVDVHATALSNSR